MQKFLLCVILLVLGILIGLNTAHKDWLAVSFYSGLSIIYLILNCKGKEHE